MNLGQSLIALDLLVVAFVLFYSIRQATAGLAEKIKVSKARPSLMVPVNEESKALYERLLTLGGPDGLPSERISKGAIQFVRRYGGYTFENCKLLSAKIGGPLREPTIVSVDCTYLLHVMGEFKFRGVEGTPMRFDCDFLVDLRNEAAVLYLN